MSSILAPSDPLKSFEDDLRSAGNMTMMLRTQEKNSFQLELKDELSKTQ